MAGGRIGFMQGRLSPLVGGRIQAFPAEHWREEFPLAQDIGFTLIEWTLDQEGLHDNPFMTPQGRAEIRTLAERYGVAVGAVTVDAFMQAPFWKAAGAERKDRMRDFKAVIEAANALGVAHVVVPLVDGGAIESAAHERDLHAGLEEARSVIERGEAKIVFESDFAPDQLQDFMAGFDPARFGVNFDIGNSASLGYAPEDEIRLYGPRIWHVHVKDRVRGGTTVPLGEGAARLGDALRLLRTSGYQGDYVLQTARAADGDHAGAAARYRRMVLDWIAAA